MSPHNAGEHRTATWETRIDKNFMAELKTWVPLNTEILQKVWDSDADHYVDSLFPMRDAV